MKKNIAVIILAAGKSTRMKSDLPKVLHPLCGRPMIDYVLDTVGSLRAKKVVLVLGHKQEEVRRHLRKGMDFALQRRLLGTADAVKAAMPKLSSFKGDVLVLYGDTPLLKKSTIQKLIKHHDQSNAAATLLTAHLEKPAGYGRVLRDKYSSICGIVEDKDADDFEKNVKEVNTGIICFDKEKLARVLRLIRPANKKKEYYLTDAVGILYKAGSLLEAVKLAEINEALGINSRADLAKANRLMQARLNYEHLQQGVSIIDPASTFIAHGVKIGRESVIYPFTVIEGSVTIGKRCSIGPFAHLREGTRLKDDILVGNFLEIVRSAIGSKTLAKHFCYIGDARIGRSANIGAGAVFANFDGSRKNTTVVGDGAFIGSDSVLVAPVSIGKKAVTGAGCVVLKNTRVSDGQIVAGVPAKDITKLKNARRGKR